MRYELNEATEQIDYGLRCPDGTVIWPPETYKGYPFETAKQRNEFPEILAGAAKELKVTPSVWISAFSWVPRQSMIYVISKVPDEVIKMGDQWPEETEAEGESPSSAPNE